MYDSVIQEILCNSPCEFSTQNLQHSAYILSCSSGHVLPKELYHTRNVYLPQILKSSFTCSSTYFMSYNSLKCSEFLVNLGFLCDQAAIIRDITNCTLCTNHSTKHRKMYLLFTMVQNNMIPHCNCFSTCFRINH